MVEVSNDTYLWLGEWSRYALIDCREIANEWFDQLRKLNKPEDSGVYRLVALDEDGRKPKSISRICGTDPTGTLYLGAASKIENRLNSLIRTHSRDFANASHTPMADILKGKYPSESLAVTWKILDDAASAFAEEYRLMGEFVRRFGEPPPLNGYGRYPNLGVAVSDRDTTMKDAI